MVDQVEKLNPSKLGTKQYWDEFYALEQQNFDENSDDEGEVWFADADAEDKIIDFIISHTADSEEKLSDELPFSRTSTAAIDLGTGNGHLLFRLRCEAGFMGNLCGIDYAETSVAFARRLLAKKRQEQQLDDPANNIKFEHVDFLKFPDDKENESWDLVLDKGTFDAIALNGDIIRDGLRGVDIFPTVVRDSLVRVGGIILITSCNFTQEELVKLFNIEGLKLWKTVKYPVYEFGGVKGQSISSVAFRRTR
ncbi:methyltransferase domain-containing protein [Lipomyces kononenkoae]|uniref:Methyltransferase domain-containing protein n=1 Tax=Lipomyces kononenkoae TaxID=34357 RepID=A0ACC3T0F4_LIPKO